MRLRKIRLAGFKSFVDPTTIAFPGSLIAVVGPNGCGKSNIMDAVRWVMGEISAKHLRGDTMADVVFTGSNTRKPVSQASVELVFDNSDGRLGGRYASYAEISVKRQVTRDSQSVYYVNGTRCRRRDVVDIFLGTGLGPRSYAIIEQGMISRIIEAKPEELREFLEEAAGISKYKERRRETENRIRHTVENLDRLSDLREELGKRLTHLKRQATMAEKYKLFKAEERELRGELMAVRWRNLDGAAREQLERVTAQRTSLEAALAGQRQVEAQLEKQRVTHAEIGERFNEVYRQVLDAGADIARSEETIQGMKQRREELAGTLVDERENLARSHGHLEADEKELVDLGAALEREVPALEDAQRVAGEARTVFRQTEEAMHAWQAEWEALTQRASEPARAVHAEEARIQQIEANLSQLDRRIEQLEVERDGLDATTFEQRIVALRHGVDEHEGALAEDDEEVASRRDAIAGHRARVAELTDALHDARQGVQTARGRHASLLALQQEALGKSAGNVVNWLRERGLDEQARLAERLDVEPGWELAVERVLGARLEAVCVETLGSVAGEIDSFPEGVLGLFEETRDASAVVAHGADSLASKIRAPHPLGSLLGLVRVAATLDEAMAMRAGLADGHSVVTPEGVWLGRDWLQVVRAAGDSSVLAREQEIKTLSARMDELEQIEQHHAAERAQVEEHLEAAEAQFADAQARVARRHRELGESRSELARTEARLEQLRGRVTGIGGELEELATRRAGDVRGLEAARDRLERSRIEVERLSGERDGWLERREQHRQRLEESRDRWQSTRDEAYDVGLRVESMRTRTAALGEAQTRYREQVGVLEARCAQLDRLVGEQEQPLRDAESGLQAKLAVRAEVEGTMKGMRAQVEQAEEGVRTLDRDRQAREAAVQDEREQLDRVRLQSQETEVRRRAVEEQIEETGLVLANLVESLDAQATEDEWVEKVANVERRITRLGPINLAAIDEHQQQSERKEYLDAQDADLREALDTLRSAIEKIDRETRARFKETYEKVNEGLGRKFPRLFGGGHASLELTGEDLLDTGVLVTARPPGKRNVSIHLLSGGEKALTAVALVFAMFELNPAPFCLLDEVDAPLDDYNVSRFCSLVAEMSETVQFLVVTHNKITMELAQQLVGVTMNEPGVSRLVAVDLDEAVQLATA